MKHRAFMHAPQGRCHHHLGKWERYFTGRNLRSNKEGRTYLWFLHSDQLACSAGRLQSGIVDTPPPSLSAGCYNQPGHPVLPVTWLYLFPQRNRTSSCSSECPWICRSWKEILTLVVFLLERAGQGDLQLWCQSTAKEGQRATGVTELPELL